MLTMRIFKDSKEEALFHSRLYSLALVSYREARGEPYRGILWVCGTVKNRVLGSRWPDTWIRVITQPWQFSAFNPNDPNANVWPPTDIEDVSFDIDAWDRCFRAAKETLGFSEDFTNGANHYHTKQIKFPNSWVRPENRSRVESEFFIAEIGNHRFYNIPPGV